MEHTNVTYQHDWSTDSGVTEYAHLSKVTDAVNCYVRRHEQTQQSQRRLQMKILRRPAWNYNHDLIYLWSVRQVAILRYSLCSQPSEAKLYRRVNRFSAISNHESWQFRWQLLLTTEWMQSQLKPACTWIQRHWNYSAPDMETSFYLTSYYYTSDVWQVLCWSWQRIWISATPFFSLPLSSFDHGNILDSLSSKFLVESYFTSIALYAINYREPHKNGHNQHRW